MIRCENKGKIRSKIALNIAKDLSYHKADDVVVYDVKNKTPFYSYLIICSADNVRKVNALKESAVDSLYLYHKDVKNVEGKHGNNWIVVDGRDIVIHVIEAKEREKLRIDELYSDCACLLVNDETVVPEVIRKLKSIED